METGTHKVILSIGCNTNCDTQLQRIIECLPQTFHDVRFTEPVTSPAYGMSKDTLPYSNMLATFTTVLSRQALIRRLKEIEQQLGDTKLLRSQGLVMMDLDILEYNGEKHHLGDWSRPYIQTLIKRLLIVILILFFPFSILHSVCAQNDDAKTLLTKAIEYFTGQKFHECILTFNKLQKDYKLNPRYKAYLGYSYYKEGEYEDALKYLEEGIPQLKAFSPFEQATYLYACAESYFNLQKYHEAIPWYHEVLPLVEGIDKGDVYYHTGFADYMDGDNKLALLYLQKADSIYTDSIYSSHLDELHIARKAQTTIMLKALRKALPPQPDAMPRKPEAMPLKNDTVPQTNNAGLHEALSPRP